MTTQNDVIVIGAGPAGLAAAIATSRNGLRTAILDARLPPLDKPCGEGILPHGVAALRSLGICLNSEVAFPFAGIHFQDAESSVQARFMDGSGFALRRTKLHHLLVERAIQAGVKFHWGASVTQIGWGFVATADERIPYKWLVGADGQNSVVRKWAGLDSRTVRRKRFGFRKHFHVCPWADFVELYWGECCQMFVTPTGAQEVGIAVLSRDPQMRVDQALLRFPALAEKLSGAIPTTNEMGDATSLRILPAVTQGCIALIGDASGTVDAVTGQGLGLSFQQAIDLAEALKQGNLSLYEASHRKLSSLAAVTSRLMLLLEGNDQLRRTALRLFQRRPALFRKLLSIHSGALPLSSIGMSEMADFGWKLLRASS